MLVDPVKDFLNSRAVRYVSIHHSPAYTGRELAEVGYIPRRRLAKTAILRVDGALVMVVLPSSHKIDFERIDGLPRLCGPGRAERDPASNDQ